MVAVMTDSAVVAGVLGLGTAGGLLLIGTAWRGRTRAIPPPRGPALMSAVRGRIGSRRAVLQAAASAGAGLVVGVVTGWVVGALLAATTVWLLPRLIGPDRVHAQQLARIEAIAAWTEMLRDVLSAAAGLEQAILGTAPLAPAAIRDQITGLASRLESGQRLAPSLRRLAGQLADPTADLVLAVLVLAAEHHARQLADLLGSLAATAREQAAMRMRVETGRARTRTTVRVIVATTLAFAAGVVAFNRAYLEAYDSAAGQVVLLLVGAVFVAGFAWLAHITGSGAPARSLALDTDTEQGAQL